MKILTSKENSRLKHLRKLIANGGYRRENREYIAEGLRILKDSHSIKELFVREGQVVPEFYKGKTYLLKKEVFDKISSTQTSQGLIGILEMNILGFEAIMKGRRYVLLDSLQDPGNMGAIIRSSCAFGIDGIILTRECTDPFSPKAVRSCAGAIEQIDIIEVEQVEQLKQLGIDIITADKNGRKLDIIHWPESFILVIGNEGSGISEEINTIKKSSVSIPISQSIESLNAGVAAGIILYTAKNALKDIK
jgi:RNA methyltransferase, TrmH family